MRRRKLYKLIRQYVKIQKKPGKLPTTHTLQKTSLPPRISRSYAPAPTQSTLRRTNTHIIALRQRIHHHKPQRHHNYRHLVAQYIATSLQQSEHHMFDHKGKKKSMIFLQRENEEKWGPSLSNELGRLAQGIRDMKCNNALTFVEKQENSTQQKSGICKYGMRLPSVRRRKYRIRLTIGGEVLYYDNNASLLETKLLLNIVILDVDIGARFMTADLKDFFMQSFLEEPVYIRIHGKYFFKDIQQKYNIDKITSEEGYVYCKILRGMYGLK